MNKIQMIHTGGPYGDCTSSYKFILNRKITLQEFAEMVVASKEEWGSIRKFSPFGEVLVDYNRKGEIKYREGVDKNMVIAKCGSANGGWSLMDYYVEIAEEDSLNES